MNELSTRYTKAQKKIFFETDSRFVVVAKGRRFGFTRGAAQFAIECLVDGLKVLWVDTTQSNLQRYYERYFLPVLKGLHNSLWRFSVQDKKITFAKSGYIDLRSAERPENLEGFGYDIVILNEAGIILKNAYLWDNAISPMLLDNHKSRAIFGGVPKGKNKFYELAQKGIKKDKNWEFLQFSSFDNPLIKAEEINNLISDLGGDESPVVKQEIFGEFVDNTSNTLIEISELEKCFVREIADDKNAIEVWSVDVARYGDDKSVIAKRKGLNVYEFCDFMGLSTTELADKIYTHFSLSDNKPGHIFIDTTGVGAGVYDILRDKGLPVYEAIMSKSPIDTAKFKNKRAEMYFNLKEKIPLLRIAKNQRLITEAFGTEYFINDKGQFMIESKDEIKKKISVSPDYLDSLAMLFYEKITPKFGDTYLDWSGNGW